MSEKGMPAANAWQKEDQMLANAFDKAAVIVCHVPASPPPHTVLTKEFAMFLAGVETGKQYATGFFEVFVQGGMEHAKQTLDHPMATEPIARALFVAKIPVGT